MRPSPIRPVFAAIDGDSREFVVQSSRLTPCGKQYARLATIERWLSPAAAARASPEWQR
jgi:hypothetical protein